MNRHDVAARLAAWHPPLATPERVALLSRLSAIYEREGVLVDGRALALHRCCPDSTACWADDRDRIGSGGHIEGGAEAGEDGSIYWPWLGRDYRLGGVCLVGWNIVHHWEWWAPLIEEFVITGNVRQDLAEGRRQSRNHSRFGYGSMASAGALLASLRGEELEPRPAPQALVERLDEVARVQTVKCSPLGDSSRPNPEMTKHCPRRYLFDELSVLEPRVLLALGVEARDAIGQAAPIRWTCREDNFQRGDMVLGGGCAEVFVVPHPGGAWARWPKGQTQLISSLQAQPLRLS